MRGRKEEREGGKEDKREGIKEGKKVRGRKEEREGKEARRIKWRERRSQFDYK